MDLRSSVTASTQIAADASVAVQPPSVAPSLTLNGSSAPAAHDGKAAVAPVLRSDVVVSSKTSQWIQSAYELFFLSNYSKAESQFHHLTFQAREDFPQDFSIASFEDCVVGNIVSNFMKCSSESKDRTEYLPRVLKKINEALRDDFRDSDKGSEADLAHDYKKIIADHLRQIGHWVEHELKPIQQQYLFQNHYSNLKNLPAEIILQTLLANNCLMWIEDPDKSESYLTRCLQWLAKPLEQGCPEAEFIYSLLQYKGWGVPQDQASALKKLRELKAMGLRKAQHLIGKQHAYGKFNIDLREVDVKSVATSTLNGTSKTSLVAVAGEKKGNTVVIDSDHEQFKKYINGNNISLAIEMALKLFFERKYALFDLCFLDLTVTQKINFPDQCHSTREDLIMCHVVSQLMDPSPSERANTLRWGLKWVSFCITQNFLDVVQEVKQAQVADFAKNYKYSVFIHLLECQYWIEEELSRLKLLEPLEDLKRAIARKPEFSNIKNLPAEIILLTRIATNYLSKVRDPQVNKAEVDKCLAFLKIPLEYKCPEAEFIYNLLRTVGVGVAINSSEGIQAIVKLAEDGLMMARLFLTEKSFNVGHFKIFIQQVESDASANDLTADVKAIAIRDTAAELPLTPFEQASESIFTKTYQEAGEEFLKLKRKHSNNGLYVLGYIIALLEKGKKQKAYEDLKAYLMHSSVEKCAHYAELQEACYWLEIELKLIRQAEQRRQQYEKYSRLTRYSNVKSVPAIMMMRVIVARSVLTFYKEVPNKRMMYHVSRWLSADILDCCPEARCVIGEMFLNHNYYGSVQESALGNLLQALIDILKDFQVSNKNPAFYSQLIFRNADQEKVPYAGLLLYQAHQQGVTTENIEQDLQKTITQGTIVGHHALGRLRREQKTSIADFKQGKAKGCKSCCFELAHHYGVGAYTAEAKTIDSLQAIHELKQAADYGHPRAMFYLGLILWLQKLNQPFRMKGDGSNTLVMVNYPEHELDVTGFASHFICAMLSSPKVASFLSELEASKKDPDYANKLWNVAVERDSEVVGVVAAYRNFAETYSTAAEARLKENERKLAALAAAAPVAHPSPSGGSTPNSSSDEKKSDALPSSEVKENITTTKLNAFEAVSELLFSGEYAKAETSFYRLLRERRDNGMYLLGYAIALLAQKDKQLAAHKALDDFLKNHTLENSAYYAFLQEACYWIEKQFKLGNPEERRKHYQRHSRFGYYSNVKNVPAIQMLYVILAHGTLTFYKTVPEEKLVSYVEKCLMQIDMFPEAACLAAEVLLTCAEDGVPFGETYMSKLYGFVSASTKAVVVGEGLDRFAVEIIKVASSTPYKVPYAWYILKDLDNEVIDRNTLISQMQLVVSKDVVPAYRALATLYHENKQEREFSRTIKNGIKKGCVLCTLAAALGYILSQEGDVAARRQQAIQHLYDSAKQGQPIAMLYLSVLLFLRKLNQPLHLKDDSTLMAQAYPHCEINLGSLRALIVDDLLSDSNVQQFLDQLYREKGENYLVDLLEVASETSAYVVTLVGRCKEFGEQINKLEQAREARRCAAMSPDGKEECKAAAAAIQKELDKLKAQHGQNDVVNSNAAPTVDSKSAVESGLAAAHSAAVPEIKRNNGTSVAKMSPLQKLIVGDAKELAHYKELADADDARAQELLADLYTEHKFDAKESVRWCKKLASKGHGVAQFRIGMFHWNKQEYKEAVKMYKKAGEKQIAGALHNLGIANAQGKGVKQVNLPQAMKYFRQAAELGDEKALRALHFYACQTTFVEPREFVRQLAEQRVKAATNIFWDHNQQLAVAGNAKANYYCGFLCHTGWGGIPVDKDQAIHYYREAIAKGYVHNANEPGDGPEKAIEELMSANAAVTVRL